MPGSLSAGLPQDNEITKAGGLTFKASSLRAKALHPDATPSEEARLEAFSAWKGDRDAARRWFDPRVVVRCEWRAQKIPSA